MPENKPAGKKSGKGKKQGQQKKEAKVKPRLLTPQEIIDYYRAHHKLPPELERSSENKRD